MASKKIQLVKCLLSVITQVDNPSTHVNVRWAWVAHDIINVLYLVRLHLDRYSRERNRDRVTKMKKKNNLGSVVELPGFESGSAAVIFMSSFSYLAR